ncbi:hypothetical protein ACWGIB_03630 [Streptomyces xiamenensis]
MPRTTRAPARRTPVLLLDEPTNHLAIGSQLELLELLELIRALNLTVVVAIHDLGARGRVLRPVGASARGPAARRRPTPCPAVSGQRSASSPRPARVVCRASRPGGRPRPDGRGR